MYDDFAHQPLLPRKMSQLSASIAWADADGDGWEDLLLAAGRGGRLALLHNDHGKFTEGRVSPIVPDGMAGMVVMDAGAAGPVALSASPRLSADGSSPGVLSTQLKAGGSLEPKPLTLPLPAGMNAGVLALADVDGDGAVDLFVGARCKAGAYPVGAPSALYLRKGDGWVADSRNEALLGKVGLVTSAVFTDLNGDGWPDLAVAAEWGPVRVYLNEHGALRDATEELGLGSFTGWWSSLAAGDFDGDGRMDLVVGSWGKNTVYESLRGKGLRLYYGDIDGDGQADLIEAHFDQETADWVPRRTLGALAEGIASLKQRFASNEAFSRVTMPELLSGKPGLYLEARVLESTVFLNREGRFEPVSLPSAAQVAPVFGISVADFDGDGREDLFLAQNFSQVPAGEMPNIAGRGLILRGRGDGRFETAGPGLSMGGDQRGAAVADYDHDGRTDLAVGVNSGEWRLFHNIISKPGIRVALRGTGANPGAIGAKFQMISTDGATTPMRELHAGSGSGSQDALIQVVHPGSSTGRIAVQWPGGLWTTNDVAASAGEVLVTQPSR